MARRVRISTISFLLGSEVATQAARYDQAFRYLEAALADGPDLILLPEMFETLGCNEWQRVQGMHAPQARFAAALELAMTEDGPVAERFLEFAARHDVTVVSNNLTREGAALYNQATFYGRHGDILGRYRKVQPTENEYEVKAITPGDEIEPIEVDGVRYGVFICNDQAFPEICQIYGLQGTDVLLHPTQAAGPTENIRSEMLRTRAHDASCYLVTSTFLQDKPLGWQYRQSHATIYDFNGFTLAETGHRAGHATATLDLDEERWTSWCSRYDHRRTILRQHRADLYARAYGEISPQKENMIPVREPSAIGS